MKLIQSLSIIIGSVALLAVCDSKAPSIAQGQPCQWNYSTNSSGQSIASYCNNIAIGVPIPSIPITAAEPVHIGPGTSNSSGSSIVSTRKVDNTYSGNVHGFSNSDNYNWNNGCASSLCAAASFDGRFTVTGTYSYDHFVGGVQSLPTFSTSGTTDNVYGNFTNGVITAGRINHAMGSYVHGFQATGSGVVGEQDAFVSDALAGNFCIGLGNGSNATNCIYALDGNKSTGSADGNYFRFGNSYIGACPYNNYPRFGYNIRCVAGTLSYDITDVAAWVETESEEVIVQGAVSGAGGAPLTPVTMLDILPTKSVAPNFVATSVAVTASAGQIAYGGTVVAASNCGSLAGAAGCIVVNIAGTAHYVPYY